MNSVCAICNAPNDDGGDCSYECAHTEEAQFDHLLSHSTVAQPPPQELIDRLGTPAKPRQGLRIRLWTYVVEYLPPAGEIRQLWIRQDGLGNWLVTEGFQMHPERYLTVDGRWSELATSDTRLDEHAARSLAIAELMKAETRGT